MSKRKFVNEVSFDQKISDLEVAIEFTRTVCVSPELYGSDADGNRGVWITSVDDDVSSNVRVTYYIDDQEQKTFALENVEDPAFRQAIEEAVDVYLNTHDAEDPGEPEEDGDDRGEDE